MVARTRETDPDRLDLREAYDRGRRDERATKKRHPIFMTLMFLAAAVGLALIVMAAVNGSFGKAGQVADQSLAVAADKAEPVVQCAVNNAGQAIDNATTDRDAAPAR